MIFLNSNEYKPLNLHHKWQLLSDTYPDLYLEISIMSNQVEVSDDRVDLEVTIYNVTDRGNDVLYNWNLPTSTKYLRDITYDISMRLMDTAKYGTPFCLERFMHDYFLFSVFDEDSGMFRFQSVRVTANGKPLIPKFPTQITDLLKEDPHLQKWINMTKSTFKDIASFSVIAAHECNRYHYLIMHVLPQEEPKPKKKKVVKKK